MRNILFSLMLLVALLFFCGCRNINVGGNGSIGTVTGGGSVNIPIPQQ